MTRVDAHAHKGPQPRDVPLAILIESPMRIPLMPESSYFTHTYIQAHVHTCVHTHTPVINADECLIKRCPGVGRKALIMEFHSLPGVAILSMTNFGVTELGRAMHHCLSQARTSHFQGTLSPFMWTCAHNPSAPWPTPWTLTPNEQTKLL